MSTLKNHLLAPVSDMEFPTGNPMHTRKLEQERRKALGISDATRSVLIALYHHVLPPAQNNEECIPTMLERLSIHKKNRCYNARR